MVSICACDGYRDLDGNEITGKIRGCKVIFKGKNAKLCVGEGFRALGKGCKLILEDNASVTLGGNFRMGREVLLFFRENARCKVGDNACLGNEVGFYLRGNVSIGDNFCMREHGELRVHGELSFADWVYLQHHVVIYVPKRTRLVVGSDTGFSWYAKAIVGSGHSCYDLRHGIKLETLGLGADEYKTTTLGDHVWVGCGTLLGGGVTIGNNSIVSANSSVMSGTFKEHLLIGGNPAREIAKDIDWDRRIDLDYEEFIAYRKTGISIVERPSFFDEFDDDNDE